MPGSPWLLYNYRIDPHGHVVAVQLFHQDVTTPYIWYWQWHDLEGNQLDSAWGTPPDEYHQNVLGLRLDARGHVVAVLGYYASGEPYHWYKIDGTDLGEEGSEEYLYVIDVRIDARGHIIAVKMTDNNWYSLDGQGL